MITTRFPAPIPDPCFSSNAQQCGRGWRLTSAKISCSWDFETRPWFPIKAKGKVKFLELYLIIFGSSFSIAAELFICPEKHQPLADDWSIPSEHLNNFEHSSISLFFLIYATVALCASRSPMQVPYGLLHVVAAFAFSQELLLFHLHSADHMGLEGQYHWLLQLIIFVCLCCTLLEIAAPQSILVALVRSMAVFFQGCWFIQMGLVLWIPAFTPKGCKMNNENDHKVVRCKDHMTEMRAKALANLQFNWYLATVVIFTLTLYSYMVNYLKARTQYLPLDHKDGISNIEIMKNAELASVPKHKRSNQGSHSSVELEAFAAVEVGR
ncbi:hypothetical protein O6H91_09G108000 [Diphasiastrum complanatum]|uniref:Uncharacterized protein n=1 Tax=Diphasiastrum complanatum TaxID=34168 RepID=A0ACC2CTC7_DIPCM|nr:hypothetical protein O6H91_09G108000 [Diphasiastrum complanatum]